ncbi:hypothetical protein ADK38_35755 [Streptomyces varsoviensis]|uniref:Uncharacterized protein n=2 Tax=Streptomyces varsoviensis TaxID=67373 RepID=A0ABR5IWS0_9ACTN|nr:hypothetical protein ADK38_35755 [Streptomyces varsoviensis]
MGEPGAAAGGRAARPRTLEAMTAAEDYERLRHLLDRLPADRAARALALLRSDPDLAPYVDEADALPPAIDRPGFAAFIGVGRSGHSDTARRHRELIQEWSDEDR